MSVESARAHRAQFGKDNDILFFQESSATVELAAHALHTQPGRIAKTLSFLTEDGPILIVCAGDARIDNRRYKDLFHQKAKMLTPQQVEEYTTHPVGGVCPFGVPEDVKIYLDESLKRFDIVYPACGSGNSAIPLTCEELAQYSACQGWVDVCKDWGRENHEETL